jgi:hypothetical protein
LRRNGKSYVVYLTQGNTCPDASGNTCASRYPSAAGI